MTVSIDEARINQEETENRKETGGGWGNDDIQFDLGLERWDVDIDNLKVNVPKHIFCAWIEDWENYDATYTIYSKNLEFQKERGLPKDEHGWS
eukprot:9013233-Ditylum_brightwellii.AAC.1